MNSTAFAALAGIVADIDPVAVVQTCPQRTEAAAHELAARMPHSIHLALDDQASRAALPARITDRIGANWGRVPGVVIACNPRGDHFAFIGDIIGVDPLTVQFANDRRVPLGRVVALGLE